MANIFKDAFDAIAGAHKFDRSDGDYYDDEGLLVCGKCGGRKQAKLNVCGEETIVNCACPCMEEAYKREEAERQARERIARIKRLKTAGFTDADMAKYTFEADQRKDSRESKVCYQYATKFAKRVKDGKGLILLGGVGCGKTFMACAIANYVMDRLYPALATNFTRIANNVQEHFEDRAEYMRSFSDYALLVIDDLGAERKSEYMNEIVYSVIDDRYRAGLPMIITTNMTLEQLKFPQGIEQARIFDRILERCFPVEFKCPSMRRQKIRDEYESMREELGY